RVVDESAYWQYACDAGLVIGHHQRAGGGGAGRGGPYPDTAIHVGYGGGHVWKRVSAFLCFFFQAEDGIRDWSVTGVQTCALPISAPAAPPRARTPLRPRPRRRR